MRSECHQAMQQTRTEHICTTHGRFKLSKPQLRNATRRKRQKDREGPTNPTRNTVLWTVEKLTFRNHRTRVFTVCLQYTKKTCCLATKSQSRAALLLKASNAASASQTSRKYDGLCRLAGWHERTWMLISKPFFEQPHDDTRED